MTITRRAATLPVSFFERSADLVARELLGTLVVSTVGGPPDQRTDRRDRGLPRPGRPGLPRLPRPAPRAERIALRPAGELVRLPVVRHALVRQPGVRPAGPRQRRAPASTGAGRGTGDHAPPASRRRRPAAVLRTRAALSGARDHAEPRRTDDGSVGREGAKRGAPARDRRPRRGSGSPRPPTGRSGSWSQAPPGLPARHGNDHPQKRTGSGVFRCPFGSVPVGAAQ